MTLAALAVVALVLPPLLRFLVIDAVFTGENRDACRPEVLGRPVGACWAFVANKINYFVLRLVPVEEPWRPNVIFFALMAVGSGGCCGLDAPKRGLAPPYFFVVSRSSPTGCSPGCRARAACRADLLWAACW